jgi:hypothetical protein
MDELRRGVAGVAIAVLALGACGGSHRAIRGTAGPSTSSTTVHSSPLQAALLRSVRATRTARTARISLSIGISGIVAGGANFSEAGTGVVDFMTEDTDLVLTTSVPGAPTTVTEERIVDSVMYVRAGTAPWKRVDLRTQLGTALSGLSSQSDPSQELAYLAAVSDEVHKDGVANVRGVAATHYLATLDMAKALRRPRLGSALRARLAVLAPKLGNQHIPIEAWVDAGGRIRRVVISYPLLPLLPAAQSGGVSPDARIHIQEDVYDFGTPVRVEAPLAGAVGG